MLSKIASSTVRLIKPKSLVYQPKNNLWFLKNLKEKTEHDHHPQNPNLTEEEIEQMSHPEHEFVTPGKGKTVGRWLLLVAGSVFVMVVIGGYTRLSHSGLSMVRWKPIGYRWPRNQDDWNEEFENYKNFPEFQLKNPNMQIEGFKYIFFWEYFHRTWGNALGFLYGLPLIYFTARGYLRPKLRNRLYGLLLLGGTQGLIGWWMVKSGLTAKPDYQSRPRVSTYRLFVHLNTAITIYSFLLWNGLNLVRTPPERSLSLKHLGNTLSVRTKMILLIHCVALNILSGVTVAGIDAGLVFNTWPDMNGKLVPPGIFSKSPLWRNFFENTATTQFFHRSFAYLTWAVSCYLFVKTRGMNLPIPVVRGIAALFAVVNLQLIIGIATVMYMVPVEYGVAHQTNALLVVTAALYTLHTVRKPSKSYIRYLKMASSQFKPLNIKDLNTF